MESFARNVPVASVSIRLKHIPLHQQSWRGDQVRNAHAILLSGSLLIHLIFMAGPHQTKAVPERLDPSTAMSLRSAQLFQEWLPMARRCHIFSLRTVSMKYSIQSCGVSHFRSGITPQLCNRIRRAWVLCDNAARKSSIFRRSKAADDAAKREDFCPCMRG